MKKIFAIMASLLVVATSLSAQSYEETLNQRKLTKKAAQAELNSKASKDARKEAKALAKDGWKVAPGNLPLERQLDRSYMMYYEYEEDGMPRYIMGEAMSIGQTYDAAKTQALELARINIAGQVQTEVTALVESTVANEQISAEEASSIVRTVQASKNLISQKLGRVMTVTEMYRNPSSSTVEARVTIAYNVRQAMNAAKQIVKEQLEERGEDLHEQLDKAMGF